MLTSDASLQELDDAAREAYFEYQQDPTANAMAAFPARDRAAFERHWDTLNNNGLARAVVVDGRIAGVVTAWGSEGERELAYWFGRGFWGRGVATAGVSLFLQLEQARPLRAHVAEHNEASKRVLIKLGFQPRGVVTDEDVRLLLLVLD